MSQIDIFPVLGGLVVSVIGYLLHQKDVKQAKEIDDVRRSIAHHVELLWQKHDQDAKDLSELRLHIASQHYVKTELDARFDRMEASFKHGFQELSGKLDKLIEVIAKGPPK